MFVSAQSEQTFIHTGINMFPKKILLSLAALFCTTPFFNTGTRIFFLSLILGYDPEPEQYCLAENNQQLFNQASDLILIHIDTEASVADPDPIPF
jgi:hypothetical protein